LQLLQCPYYFSKSTKEVFSAGADLGEGAPDAPPTPLNWKKIWFFWRKIVIFHTKYPNNFRASLRSTLFFLNTPLLTWNPGSAPVAYMECGTVPNTLPIMVHGQPFRIITWQPPSRGLPLSATRGWDGQLCGF
jgi:hypothetical protein